MRDYDYRPKYRLRYRGIHLLTGKALWQCYVVFGTKVEQTSMYVK